MPHQPNHDPGPNSNQARKYVQQRERKKAKKDQETSDRAQDAQELWDDDLREEFERRLDRSLSRDVGIWENIGLFNNKDEANDLLAVVVAYLEVEELFFPSFVISSKDKQPDAEELFTICITDLSV